MTAGVIGASALHVGVGVVAALLFAVGALEIARAEAGTAPGADGLLDDVEDVVGVLLHPIGGRVVHPRSVELDQTGPVPRRSPPDRHARLVQIVSMRHGILQKGKMSMTLLLLLCVCYAMRFFTFNDPEELPSQVMSCPSLTPLKVPT